MEPNKDIILRGHSQEIFCEIIPLNDTLADNFA
jgi:hypothetical protein